jgi:hypothetical protein
MLDYGVKTDSFVECLDSPIFDLPMVPEIRALYSIGQSAINFRI